MIDRLLDWAEESKWRRLVVAIVPPCVVAAPIGYFIGRVMG